MAPDGNIYGIPSHADKVLKVNTQTQEVTQIGPALKGRYKWGGAVVGNDGAIYGIPSDTDQVTSVAPLLSAALFRS